MDETPLDYPVVKQHLYRGYYRTHDFSGEESIHGQIVLDFWHGGSLDGRTIVLHGHRMRDWSMFHVIAEMDGQDYFDAHPTVQFAHPGGVFSARWFAGALYYLEDPWPETVSFADDAEYRGWLDRIAQNNRLSCPITPGVDDRVLVCCTCAQASEENDPDGYALFAVIES